MRWRAAIPWSMVVFRALSGPALIAVAMYVAAPQPWLGAMIAAGVISDFFDGFLAHRWGTASAALRLSDSAVDTLFYLCILATIVIRHGPALRERLGLLIALLVLEAVRAVFDYLKYGRISSYHSYASKLWGLLLAAATITVLCFDRGFWLLTAALAWGILCDVEGLVFSALLPEWTHDVKTVRHALEARRAMQEKLAVHVS